MSRNHQVAYRRPVLRQIPVALCVATILVLGRTECSYAQSSSAGLTGTIFDTSGAIVAGATVTATHQATATRRQVQSANDGSFTITTLPPGAYVVVATQRGFRALELRDVVLNVDDRLALRLVLEVAGTGEEITVVSEAPRINTSPAVSTVIDRAFVENLPLNGRSFQALLQLTPGVTLTTPGASDGGQFNVNGQRSAENYFTVDGVSANVGASASTTLGSAGSGQLPAFSAVGGTSALVSVDALEEFRLQTSTYAPEYGRSPGGQVSLVTRSGTNEFHGSVFEYFRDDALDATDWFIKRDGGKEAPFHQHNFGGVLGGPILRNRVFAFGSYEGLRLLSPQVAVTTVPSVAVRQTALPALQPYLAALPLPNGRDLGNGFSEFLASYSDPAKLHSTSIRIDHNAFASLRLFGRYSDAPSSSTMRSDSYGHTLNTEAHLRTGTFGATWVMSDRMVNDLRANISYSEAPVLLRQDPIGGATLLPLDTLPSGRSVSRTQLTFVVNGGGFGTYGPLSDYPQRQFNIVNSLTRTITQHEIKTGVDFRWTSATAKGGGGSERYAFDIGGLGTGQLASLSLSFRNPNDRPVAFNNLSLYVQDHWRIAQRLTLTYGIRWDLVPPPNIAAGPDNPVLNRTDDLYTGQVGLAPAGTKLWRTRYSNFAPRIGGSYVLSDRANGAMVLKGGFGMFYGLGYGQIANAFGTSYPFTATRRATNIPFPVSADLYVPPVFGVSPPGSLTIADQRLKQPSTLQWNVTVEQELGPQRNLTVGYVGSHGNDLLKLARYQVRLNEWPTTVVPVDINRNVGHSDYHSLQVQFQQRVRQGMQVIASYTLGRSRDTGSVDASVGVPADRLPPSLDYGYSNFDVRHLFSGALTYQMGELSGPRLWRSLARNWGADLMVRARSGYPISITTTIPFPPDTQSVRPNVVPGQPIWLDDNTAAGGRVLNRAAFVIPPAQTQGDLPRGSVRGFGMSQLDLAIHRELQIVQPVRLQFRIEAFNLLNTPNFADPVGTLAHPQFGQSAQMLNRGLGGQNPLYQAGGPRSLQVAVKARF